MSGYTCVAAAGGPRKGSPRGRASVRAVLGRPVRDVLGGLRQLRRVDLRADLLELRDVRLAAVERAGELLESVVDRPEVRLDLVRGLRSQLVELLRSLVDVRVRATDRFREVLSDLRRGRRELLTVLRGAAAVRRRVARLRLGRIRRRRRG